MTATITRSFTKDQQRRLFVRYHRHGDLEARERLVGSYMPFARHLARRYHRADEPFEDLVQVANLGLVKAVDRFDVERGREFPSYAAPTILGELKRHFRNSRWALHVPRGLQEKTLAVGAAIEELHGRLGHSPKPNELADHLDWPVEDVLEAMQADAAFNAVPLDPLPDPDDDRGHIADVVGEPDAGLERAEDRAVLRRAFDGLPERERSILVMRFAADMTQSEIGERVGLSQMHVSRLISRSLEQLRVAVGAAAGIDSTWSR